MKNEIKSEISYQRQSVEFLTHIKMPTLSIQLLLLLTLFVFTACKNYHNDTIKWADSLEIGTDIHLIKDNQPDFLEISWDNPVTLDNAILYEITKIKGNNYDALYMTHYLVFVDGKYQGRKPHK
jgi:hypothetical protein